MTFIFDADIIVLSGGITNAGDALLKPLREKTDKNIQIEISQFKNDAGVIGAAMLQ